MKLDYMLYIYYIFIFTIILNFHQATHISLIHNKSYRQSPQKRKNNDEHEQRDNINT